MAKKNNIPSLSTSRGIGGIERGEILARGGQQSVILRGGFKSGYEADRKKKISRLACRKKVKEW